MPVDGEEYGGAGGNFSHESAVAKAIGHVRVDGFGISLRNGIVPSQVPNYESD